jgi:hypothetical protein
VITSVRDQPIKSNTELRNTIGMLKVGETVAIGLLREGKPRTVTAVLREPAQLADARPSTRRSPAPSWWRRRKMPPAACVSAASSRAARRP